MRHTESDKQGSNVRRLTGADSVKITVGQRIESFRLCLLCKYNIVWYITEFSGNIIGGGWALVHSHLPGNATVEKTKTSITGQKVCSTFIKPGNSCDFSEHVPTQNPLFLGH